MFVLVILGLGFVLRVIVIHISFDIDYGITHGCKQNVLTIRYLVLMFLFLI